MDDLRPEMPLVSGRLRIAQAIARRLITPRGRVPWWPDYGTDLRSYLLSKVPPARVASDAQAEILKQEGVESAQVTASYTGTSLELRVVLFDAQGPFTFTLTIHEAAEKLIELQLAA